MRLKKMWKQLLIYLILLFKRDTENQDRNRDNVDSILLTFNVKNQKNWVFWPTSTICPPETMAEFFISVTVFHFFALSDHYSAPFVKTTEKMAQSVKQIKMIPGTFPEPFQFLIIIFIVPSFLLSPPPPTHRHVSKICPSLSHVTSWDRPVWSR